jgi:prepilin peptidase CpaA
MPEFDLRLIVFLLFVASFTIAAAVSDIRFRKIPNKMTVPMFLAGLVYRIAFFDPSGFGDGLLAFVIGFGGLFVLWMVGGGGGGDVKLMGALSVWLGFHMTLWVLAGSVLYVIAGTLGVMTWSVLTRGVKKTKKQYLATGKIDYTKRKNREKTPTETASQKQDRRVMAFAVPAALATWTAVIINFARFPWL